MFFPPGASSGEFSVTSVDAVEHGDRKTFRFEIEREISRPSQQDRLSQYHIVRIHFDIFFSNNLKQGRPDSL